MPATAAALRRAPLLRQLVQSMQAPVLEAQDARRERDARSDRRRRDRRRAAARSARSSRAAAQGRRLAAVHPAAARPCRARILIHCDSEAARSATLGLVASVMRHLHAEATFVSVQSPTAPRAEVTSAFRRLLDARAELQETHGLDIRTDVQIGDLNELGGAAGRRQPTGAGGARPGRLARRSSSAPCASDFRALFSDASRCAVLLSCTGTAALAAQPRRRHRPAVPSTRAARSAARDRPA